MEAIYPSSFAMYGCYKPASCILLPWSLQKYWESSWRSSYHEDASVAVSVDAPQFQVCFGLDGGSSRSPVDEGQLSKTTSFSDTGHPLTIHIHLQTEQKQNL